MKRPWLRAVCLLPLLIATQPAELVHAAAHSTNSAAAQPATATGVTMSGPTREIFGFATAGSLGDPMIGYPSWNFNLLSTVAFYAVRVNYDGVLIADSNWSVFDSPTFTNLVNTAHAHGVKVVVVLRNAFSDTVDFCDMLYNGNTTVLQIVNQVKLKGIDGVNIDYEAQLAQCTPTNPGFTAQSDQALLTAFAKNLRAGLDAVHPGYYLSIDTYSGSAAGPDGFFNIPDLNQYVDSFFVMAYDMDYSNQGLGGLSGCAYFCMTPVSPLGGSYTWNDTTSMSQYVAAVGAGKVILGQPYYGRVACVNSTGEHAHATGNVRAAGYLDASAAITATDVKPGTYVVHRGDSLDPNGADRWDTWYDLTYNCWSEMYWPDATQLGARYDLVNVDNLRGVGFWTLNYGGGANELWSAISYYFTSCKGVTMSAAPPTKSTVGSTVSITAHASGCRNPTYQFWVLAPGAAAYTVVQPYSSSSTFAWNTTGLVPGSYRLAVWAEDANSPGRFNISLGHLDASTSMPYDTSSCTGASLSVSPASTIAVGGAVTITAHSSGCPSSNPNYQFWLLPPGSKTWQVARPYSTNATFTWTPIGVTPGTWQIAAWVLDANSGGAFSNALGHWDAFSSAPYAVTSCSSVAFASAPPSTVSVGASVTVTAKSAGCPNSNPNYQFWLLKPGATRYELAQPYSGSGTFTWSTNGVTPGAYRVGVWVTDADSSGRFSNSLGQFDASANSAFVVGTCTGVTLSATAANSGNVILTAKASGCPNPNTQFQFWILAPGANAYQVAQAYSTSSTYSWSTAGLAPGSYRVAVWIRDASSGGQYSNSLGTFDSSYSAAYSLK